MWEIRGSHSVLVGKPEVMTPLGRPKPDGKIIFKIGL
jgi:hypothetical protein